ncbi:hypothetical protein MTR67_046078 [Solanum verrucosum]|uniref:Glycosyltransferase N-terminal domain-containing protein n=1 Tax=Solanum verrucosum TaxID=315347 RepID=A0AAF0UWP7_SOLVR|nr:hypothetical protein MTR67_046078 [Solanum verrucosum]
MKFNSGKIFNTCRVMESPFLDLLSKEVTNNNEKQWALGPFNPITFPKNGPNTKSHTCLLWLDKQEPNSVILVSFGTTTSFSDEQIKEIAIGLEQSEQKFIWVLRDADKGNVFTKDSSRKIELPKGWILESLWMEFLHGKYLDGRANSCMANALMLKIGIVVREWANRNELVKSNVVKKCVEKLMASKGGDEMRNKAKYLSVEIRKSVAEGGIKRIELDSYISHITR